MIKCFYKTKFSFLCTPIDKTTQKNFYKIKFSYQYRYTSTNFSIFFCVCVLLVSFGVIFQFIRCGRYVRGFWRQMPVYTLLAPYLQVTDQ